MAYLNWGLGFGSIEAFYQFEWQNTSIDSCGTYWAVTESQVSSDPGLCNAATHITQVYGSALPNGVYVPQLGSNVFAQANGLYVPLVDGKDASDDGQFGLAIRIPVDAIDTEFGLYGMNLHSRLPIISGISGTNPNEIPEPYRSALIAQGVIGSIPARRNPAAVLAVDADRDDPQSAPVHAALIAQATGGAVQVSPGRSFWEYPEDIQVYGLTAATNLLGWSVSAELSHSVDVPVQVNGNDLLQSLLAFVGPNAPEESRPHSPATAHTSRATIASTRRSSRSTPSRRSVTSWVRRTWCLSARSATSGTTCRTFTTTYATGAGSCSAWARAR
jgi:hypothetical protein